MKQIWIICLLMVTGLFATEDNRCWSFNAQAFEALYAKAHMKKDIDEVILSVPKNFVKEDPLVLYVKQKGVMYKQPWIFCEPLSQDYRCSVEDDGGHFIFTKTDHIQALSLAFLKKEESEPTLLFTLKTKGKDAVKGKIIACPGKTSRYTFLLHKEQKAELIMQWDSSNISIKTPRGKVLFSEFLDDFSDMSSFDVKNFIFEDVNFDGYNDVGVAVGVGYGGVNVMRDYYVYLPKSKRFEKELKEISNLKRHLKEKLLFSQMKSGPEYFMSYYRIDKKDKPYRIIKGHSYWPEEEEADMRSVYESKAVRVGVKRSYFYDVPGAKKSKVYIMKGESVGFRDLKEEGKGDFWAEVVYKNKKRTYVKWVKLSDLVFEALSEDN